MNVTNHNNIRALIDRLTLVALADPDDDRARDARDTLCAMALIRCTETDPNYPGEVLPFIERAVGQTCGIGEGSMVQ